MDSRLFSKYNQQALVLVEWPGKVKGSEIKEDSQVSGFDHGTDGVKFQCESNQFTLCLLS